MATERPDAERRTGDRAEPPDAVVPAGPWTPGRIRSWWSTNRSQAELALIGAIAIGGIVCMMIVTAIALVIGLRS